MRVIKLKWRKEIYANQRVLGDFPLVRRRAPDTGKQNRAKQSGDDREARGIFEFGTSVGFSSFRPQFVPNKGPKSVGQSKNNTSYFVCPKFKSATCDSKTSDRESVNEKFNYFCGRSQTQASPLQPWAVKPALRNDLLARRRAGEKLVRGKERGVLVHDRLEVRMLGGVIIHLRVKLVQLRRGGADKSVLDGLGMMNLVAHHGNLHAEEKIDANGKNQEQHQRNAEQRLHGLNLHLQVLNILVYLVVYFVSFAHRSNEFICRF
jgi:hypothetical protein